MAAPRLRDLRLPQGVPAGGRSGLPDALAAQGFAVLVLDLHRSAPSGDADSDSALVRRAGEWLLAEHGAPALLVGHSDAGPPVLAAAESMTGVRAVVTVGSPAARRRFGGAPLLVLHAPDDPVVSVREAGRVFAAARHPRSFVALDRIDHAVSDERGARHVASVITAWAEPYLPEATAGTNTETAASVVVTAAGTGRYAQRITVGGHLLAADEPVSVGGADIGPNPYELLLAALGACTAVTIRDVRRPQGPAAAAHHRPAAPRPRTRQGLRRHPAEIRDARRIRLELEIEGPLADEDRRRLVEIADLCPVHRTLNQEIAFETTTAHEFEELDAERPCREWAASGDL